jgi:hypothetical protein
MRYVGSLIRQDFMVREIASVIVWAFLMQEQSGHRAIHTLLKRSGFSDELLQEWSKNIDEGKSSISTGVSCPTISGFAEMMSLNKPMWFRTCIPSFYI